jgi:hypothetical protein
MSVLTLQFLSGLMGMSATSTDTEVATALEKTLPAAREAQARATKLEADLVAANARASQAETARDAALLALESVPPAPAPPATPEAKFKAGDKVLYREGEKTVTASMGPEIVYEFQDGEYGPESKCEPMNGAVAVAFSGNLRVLSAYAARVPGQTLDAGKLAALAKAAVANPASLADALAQIDASVPKDAKAKTAASAALAMLQPPDPSVPSPDPVALWQQRLAAAR